MPVPRLLAAALLLVLTGCSIEARTSDDVTRQVRGRVLAANGEPYAGARVEVGELRRAPGKDELRSRAQTTSGGDGKFRLDVKGDSYASRLHVTDRDQRTASLSFDAARRVRVPDLRLWSPEVTVTRTMGTQVRISWSPAPYDTVSYGVRLPGADFPDEVAAPDRSIVVDPLRDGPGTFVLVADATLSKPRVTVRLEVPVTDPAVDVRPVPPVRCTVVDGHGRSRPVAGCRLEPAATEGADDAPSFVYAELARPVSVAAVRVEGCSFFCTFYVSADGRRWHEEFAGAERIGFGAEAVRLVRPDKAVTTRWLGVASRPGSPFEGDSATVVAQGGEGMPFRSLAVYPGRPSTGRAPDRAAYREPERHRLGEDRDEPPGAAAEPVDREGPLPKDGLVGVLLLLVCAGVTAFLVQDRLRGGAR